MLASKQIWYTCVYIYFVESYSILKAE